VDLWPDDEFDDEFPAGLRGGAGLGGGAGFEEDALPDEAAWVYCPYCASGVELLLDPGGGPVQSYIEDCEVCCRPWHLSVHWDADGRAWVDVRTEEE
jgi:hypothetical protein